MLGKVSSEESTDDRPLPPVDAIVATRLSDGQPAFAKVVRTEADDALVMVLKNQRTDQPDAMAKYVPDVGNILRRNLTSELVWPVDSVYNPLDSCYEVRTSLAVVAELIKANGPN